MKFKVIKALSETGLNKKELENLVETPKDKSLGDYSFPCFSLAKKFKKNPSEIAENLVGKIKSENDFEKVEAVGGYVNFFVDGKELFRKVVSDVLKEGKKYGSSSKKNLREKIMVEFSQPNTHKAFHVGHLRGTSLGESLARILEFSGNKVVRANYSGDTGMHVAKWIWYYKKYYKKELSGDEGEIAKIYVDAVKKIGDNKKYIAEVEEINRKLHNKKDKELERLWRETRKISLDAFERIYSELNTHFDEYFFESEVEDEGKKIAEELVKKKIAEVSDGAVIMDLKKYGLNVWVLLRSDGTVLYSAKDLALAERKFKRFKIDRSIYVVGAAQRLHFYQLFKTLELMGFKEAKKCEYVPVTEVRFPWGKMSSRTGENTLYSEFKEKIVGLAVKEVEKRFKLESTEVYDRALAIAIASMKYVMLKQDTNKNLIFDPKEALKFEGDTGPYLLYSYARAQSILRKAKYRRTNSKLESLKVKDSEKTLTSEILRFPEIVSHASINLAPNLIANYAYELSKRFNEFYHDVQVIGSNEEKNMLKLVDAFSQTLENSLDLLGIPVIEVM